MKSLQEGSLELGYVLLYMSSGQQEHPPEYNIKLM